jgi:hypothetical protein
LCIDMPLAWGKLRVPGMRRRTDGNIVMPARVVVALAGSEFTDLAEQIASALKRSGIDAAAFTASMPALTELEGAQSVEVLMTSIRFAPNTPNGVALARMARVRRPQIKALFIGDAELSKFTDGLGEFIESPLTVPDAVQAVRRLLPSGAED